MFRTSPVSAGLCLLLAWHTIASGQAPSPEPTPPASTSLAAISANDLILVKVFQEDDLESTLRVAEDGTVTFPLIGKIKVQDKTPQEAAALIRERLMDGYLKNPQITVTVIDHNKRRFTVLGQVQRPGSYDMPDRDSLSLLQGIGMAGGYTSIANAKRVILKRRVNGKETVYKINAEKMASGGESSTFQILPGDVITVTESWF
jgi:protein involved in polysaccharide export with SLBB domain